jgi:ABC-type nitrate/sulfonate/bicarbonate transport system, permease component
MTFLFVAVVGLWDLVTRMGWVSAIILPTPKETLDDVIFVGENLMTGGYMLEALWTTTLTVIYAFAIAIGIGFSLGVLVGETKFGERAVMPYLVAIDTMPKVAFAPLFIAWLGFDISSKVALAAFIATFPIVVATAAGLYAATENERMLFKSVGASRLQILTRLKLPTGLPYFFTGLKIAAVGVMAGAITGEFLGGGKVVRGPDPAVGEHAGHAAGDCVDPVSQSAGAGALLLRRLDATTLRLLEQVQRSRWGDVTWWGPSKIPNLPEQA